MPGLRTYDNKRIPKLGGKIQEALPEDWLAVAFKQTQSFRRVVRIDGPYRPRQIFGRPTYALVYVYHDHIAINRMACTNAQFDLILQAIKESSDLPVRII